MPGQVAPRIAIDGRKLHDFGIGTYLQNLLRELARLEDDAEYVVLCRPDDVGWLTALGPRIHPVVTRAGNYSLREQIEIPWRLWRAGVALFHSPHYVLPVFVPCPSVVTIHDCIHLMFPQYLPNRLAIVYARFFMWWATRRARRVLTVSEASKRDILRFCRIPSGKVTVIHNAIDDRFRAEPPAEEVERIRERFQLHEPFVLYVGNVKPHKNLGRLIEAVHHLHENGYDALKLLVIGSDISKYAELRRAIHTYSLHRYVRFLGFVPDQTLQILYRLTSVFAFPSLYEGFGLPPLEAMACGAPVVTSNVSSLPEVVGDAAVLVDPTDARAIAEGLAHVLADPNLRADLRRRGVEHARSFSWAAGARAVRGIYTEAIGADRIGAGR
jgi:glycosyltransferase involved in cell wall biosynthesis